MINGTSAQQKGVQYVLGLPVKDNPALFSQVVLAAGELGWLLVRRVIMVFLLAGAQRVEEEPCDYLAACTTFTECL